MGWGDSSYRAPGGSPWSYGAPQGGGSPDSGGLYGGGETPGPMGGGEGSDLSSQFGGGTPGGSPEGGGAAGGGGFDTGSVFNRLLKFGDHGTVAALLQRPNFVARFQHWVESGLDDHQAASMASAETMATDTSEGSPSEAERVASINAGSSMQRERMNANTQIGIAAQGNQARASDAAANNAAMMARQSAQQVWQSQQNREAQAAQMALEQARIAASRDTEMRTLAFNTWKSELDYQTRRGAPGFVGGPGEIRGRVG